MQLKTRSRHLISKLVPLALVCGVGAVIAAQAPLSGAVFTTNSSGTFVNANVYDDGSQPYLNGGPRPNSGNCTAAGLPNGDYYFQVTDPSGNTLLSSDDLAQRTFTVTDGVITAYGGTHATGTGRCGDITIQLAPFSATPNEGGEYKVWVTPVASYSPGNGAWGFVHQSSKTDNFKVASVTDTDGDGIPDVDDKCPTIFDPTNLCYTTR